ncbi:putative rna binding protein [Schistosoma mansoni]|uniref:putative rna binding protein n=1 Tax=Schistosoma mansoni TaxID=6183 RepID=UPI0001A63E49|nr:putative rna binding protein [Schistosoma mansoni]|eukprot:XP_018650009.1 putative rna binding protein [Schistosoma mansoni]
MGKQKAKKIEDTSLKDNPNDFTFETGKSPKTLKIGAHKHHNKVKPINHNDHNASLSSNKIEQKNEAVIVKGSKKDKKLKRKHSPSDARSDNTILDSTVLKSEMRKESASESPFKKKKHNSTSNGRNECDLNNKIACHGVETLRLKTNNKETSLEDKIQNLCSVLDVHPKSTSDDQKAPERSKEVKVRKNKSVNKSKGRKIKENVSSLGIQSQGISSDQTVSNTSNESKLPDDIKVSCNSSKSKKCKQNAPRKIENGKWYHEFQLSNDEEYFTSDESSIEVDNSQSRSLQRQHRRLSNERLSRTIFVGNLPLNITKKRIEALFNNVLKNNKISSSDCCVESVRFRGVIPVTGGTSRLARKRAAITGEFSVDKATDNDKTHCKLDNCVFVGNLPFDCTEEEIYSTLSTLGSIKSVRLIRDSQTGAVRGFGYVAYNDPSIIPLAIRSSNTLSIRERQIRIMEYKVKKIKNKEGYQQTKFHHHRHDRNNKIFNTDPKKKDKREKKAMKKEKMKEKHPVKLTHSNTDDSNSKKMSKNNKVLSKKKNKKKKIE